MSVLTKYFYHWVGDRVSQTPTDWFMNLGYTEKLGGSQECTKVKHQLYDQVVSGVDLEDKMILEVGCGRGGGAQMLCERSMPKKYIATDLSKSCVSFCQQQHQHDRLHFEQANAHRLPYPDNHFDVVINVESSHCYARMTTFLAEVHRVLRPDGVFCFCDIRSRNQLNKLRRQFERYFGIQRDVNISQHVVAARRAAQNMVRADLEKLTPGWKRIFRKPLNNWAAMPGTTVYNGLENGELYYLIVQARNNKLV